MTSIFNDKNDFEPRRKSGFQPSPHEYRGVPSLDYDDDRAEKPWQRVPSTLLIVLLGVYLLFGYFAQLVEDAMPNVVLENSLDPDNSDTFSEESALRYLDVILGNNPRVAGTVYHLEKTQDMKNLVDSIAANATIPIHTDWQMVTGDYFLRSASPFFNYYQNCSNIIAVLEGESGFHSNGTLSSSILVNCHYDSVPWAMGASDNGVFCAVMAESLSRLSKRKTKLKHNVVFLFNGAEENPLQASNAFLLHPWARGIISVINLDAAGMNGKPTIFQVTDPRILSAYSRTSSRPTAQGLAEFLFTSGIIPSDTDFRIFRDFGNIHGIDIAFTKWGHVYHTRNDRAALLNVGVVQNAGTMLLALVADVADNEDMDHKIAPTAAVYFDYCNVFMVTYSFDIAYVLDLLIVVVGTASVMYYLWLVGFRWSSFRELLWTSLGRILSLLSGVVVVAVFTAIMVATTVQMRYLSQPWIVVPLYWLPFIITTIAVSQTYDKWRCTKSGLSRSLRTIQAMASTRLLLTLILLTLVCIPGFASMRYLIAVPLFILSVTACLSITVVRYVTLTGWQHLILEVLLSLPSVMWLFSLSLRLDAMMLPIMGRSANSTPDYVVAMLNVGLAVLATTAVSGIELLFSRRRLWLVLSTMSAVCIVIMFIPFSPYDDHVAVQRHYWFHSEISSFDINSVQTYKTSGVLITKQDPYTFDEVVPSLNTAGFGYNVRRGFAEDCNTALYCGMPIYRTSFGPHIPNAMFISTNPPTPFDPPVSFSVQSKVCAGDACTYEFVLRGGPHNIITFWPHPNITLSQWSLMSPPEASSTMLGRPVYVIFHSTATYMESWSETFTLEFNVPQSLQSGPIVEVSLHSHKLYHPLDMTSEYRSIIGAMPAYFNIAPAMSFRYNYVF